MEILHKYFPDLSPFQIDQFRKLGPLYTDWNNKINLVSRKDIDQLYERHVLHSLSLAKVIQFAPGTKLLDVGTGGGFPGIPLAIFFPEVKFHLIDSIGKKVAVVEAVAEALKLKNVSFEKARAETLSTQFDFIISRAVTALPVFCNWVDPLINRNNKNEIENGILYLKGGDFSDELKEVRMNYRLYWIRNFFSEAFFDTKNIVHLFP
ncbi:MAG: 16S rRNA (guanine(527)-N(7))-methyltransferase RsmG [Bacteroidales bacterium]|nr:16S rRNA (guanine(527)-N(7))-methyltransferase RsmG [Bacteroidales bacterium]MCF8405250.1 16S rRNA (guanine(527)-N(7))-methyltransferase RsmG [Bacteroidales bacterium]